MDMVIESRKWAKPTWLLLGIAILFHSVGLVGIGILHNDGIRRAAPFHMLLMAVLLFISFKEWLRKFLLWAAIIAISCLAAEWIGVHYGWLFGGYWYGDILGVKWQGIPPIIGLNWVLVTTGAIAISEQLSANKWMVAPLAATLASAYDYILEPLAMKLGYWDWKDGDIPVYNYLCWWVLSALSATLWSRFGLRGNLFSRFLFILQLIFFILLRLLL